MYFTHFLCSIYTDSRNYRHMKIASYVSVTSVKIKQDSFSTKIVRLFVPIFIFKLFVKNEVRFFFFSSLPKLLLSWKLSHLGLCINSLGHKRAIKQITVSRSQRELMLQLMMKIYPSVSEKNYQTAFLLCALSYGLKL